MHAITCAEVSLPGFHLQGSGLNLEVLYPVVVCQATSLNPGAAERYLVIEQVLGGGSIPAHPSPGG